MMKRKSQKQSKKNKRTAEKKTQQNKKEPKKNKNEPKKTEIKGVTQEDEASVKCRQSIVSEDDYGFLRRERCKAFRVKKKAQYQDSHDETMIGMDNQQFHQPIFVAHRVSEHSSKTPSTDYRCGSSILYDYTQLPRIDAKDGQSSKHIRPYQNEEQIFTFYQQKTLEQQRARSSSRASTLRHSEPSPELITESCSINGRQSRSRTRHRSKSRDIVALYTSRSLPRSDQHERSPSAFRSHEQLNYFQHEKSPSAYRGHEQLNYFRSKSVSTTSGRQSRCSQRTDLTYVRSKSESRCSSAARDTLSLCSTLTNQSRCLSTSEIAAENLQLWMTTTSKHQRSSSKSRGSKHGSASIVTMLEMDHKKNEEIERQLDNANSMKPVNIPMMVIAGYTPSDKWEANDELVVKPNSKVIGLYKQKEWLFVEKEDKSQGFIPFSYTKPIKTLSTEQVTKPKVNKVSQSSSCDQGETPRSINGILKTSKGKSRHSDIPKFSVKVRTRDTESVSSENSSVFIEDFIYTRKPNPVHNPPHADCIVIDGDEIDKFRVPREEFRTYCSDSGISEPLSNNSDDLDPFPLPSLAIAAPNQLMSASRSSSTSNGLSAEWSTLSKSLSSSNFPTQRSRCHDNFIHISEMPLGPVGKKLSRQGQSTDNSKRHKHLDKHLTARKTSADFPASLRPEIPKDYNGPRAAVLYDYEPENTDDLQVHASDVVTVLNEEDIEWIWVQRRDGQEGFIPKDFVIPQHVVEQNRRRVAVVL